jgi:GNAT superfamily N-acetyltransferase
MSSITYRLATPEDVQQLVELRILMQVEVNGLTNLDVTTAYLDKVIDYFEESLGTDKYSSVIALDEKYIIAAAGVCFYKKPPSIAGGSGVVGYVTNVYTREEYRGRGIGTQLMKDLNELALKKRVDKLHLGATVDGVSIYKSVGYQEPKFVNLEIKFNKFKDSH